MPDGEASHFQEQVLPSSIPKRSVCTGLHVHVKLLNKVVWVWGNW